MAVGLGFAVLALLGVSFLAPRLPLAVPNLAVPLPSQPATVSTVGLREGDLPAGMLRCPISGSMESYLGALQASGSPAYEMTAAEWTRLRRLGATSAYVSSWVSQLADCQLPAGGRTHPCALSIVVSYPDAASGRAAFRTGFLGLRPTAPVSGLKTGQATGLGPDSWSFREDGGRPPTDVRFWARRSFNVFLLGESLSASEAGAAARNIDARVR